MSRDIFNRWGCSEPDLECFQGWASPLLWETCSNVSVQCSVLMFEYNMVQQAQGHTAAPVRLCGNKQSVWLQRSVCHTQQGRKAEHGCSSFSPAGKSMPMLLLMLRRAANSPADLFHFIFCRTWSTRVRKFYHIKWTAYQVLTLSNRSALLLILGNANIAPPQDQYPLCWRDCPDHMILSHTGIYFHEMPAKYSCFKKTLKLSYLEFFLVLTVRIRSPTVKQSLSAAKRYKNK